MVANLVGKRQMQRQTPPAQATNSSAMQSRKLYVVEISSSFHVPEHQVPRGNRAPVFARLAERSSESGEVAAQSGKQDGSQARGTVLAGEHLAALARAAVLY